ncbi:MAG: SAM-dependent methyltransferase [Rhodobacterales bacterium]|nr:MAG: SAM-dependent methyltransferase [Rhodobacterales bacterium]
MSTDRETLEVYTGAAEKYAGKYAKGGASSKNAKQAGDWAGFVALLPPGGRVLDLGCGPGHWAARLREAGYIAEASDATPAMAELAAERYGLAVRVEPFEALDAVPGRYDGIWANFSLLHAPRAQFPGHLARVFRALKPGGVFHIGMKLGTAEGRDSLGRFYAYYGEEELKQLLESAGFTVVSVRRGNGEGLAGGVETFVTVTCHG